MDDLIDIVRCIATSDENNELVRKLEAATDSTLQLLIECGWSMIKLGEIEQMCRGTIAPMSGGLRLMEAAELVRG